MPNFLSKTENIAKALEYWTKSSNKVSLKILLYSISKISLRYFVTIVVNLKTPLVKMNVRFPNARRLRNLRKMEKFCR